ncbi:MAG: radical SAM protein, partial [Chloroflexi bacterium]|nr:radical SAM protein [Chloroflexota bacterium]
MAEPTATPIPIRFLVLMLTGACNLRCRYCFASAVTGGAMARTTALQALDRLAAHDLPMVIELAGGEPLLAFDLLKDVVTYAQTVNPQAQVALQTNGTLLDEDKLAFLIKHRVGIGISMDGIPAVNNAQRGDSIGTLRALKLLEAYQQGVNVMAVLTYASIMHIDEFLVMCAVLPAVRTVNLDIVRPTGRAGWDRVPTEEQITQMVAEMLETLAFINARRFPPLKVREVEHVIRRQADVQTRPYCHAAEGRA